MSVLNAIFTNISNISGGQNSLVEGHRIPEEIFPHCKKTHISPQTGTNLSTLLQSEWVSDCCLMPNEQFFSNIMARTS